MLSVINIKEQYVFHRAVDLGRARAVPISTGTWEELREASVALYRKSPGGAKGLYMFEGRPMLLAIRPILTTDNRGPSRGILVVGRFFDRAMLREMAKDVELPLYAWRYGDKNIPGDMRIAGRTMPHDRNTLVREIDRNIIAGYVRLDDINGKSVLFLGFHQPRELIEKAKHSLVVMMCSMLVIGFLIITLAVTTFLMYVQQPLRGIIEKIIKVADSSDSALRVSMEGSNEFDALARSINRMLDAPELAQSQVVAAERLAVLGRFSGSVAHEIRNPLGVIDSSAFLLGSMLKDTDPKVRRHIDQISDESAKCSRIIDGIVSLSRIKPLDPVPVSVLDCLRDFLRTFTFPENIRVEWEREEDVTVAADHEQLRIAVKNIITNAIQAMPGGGVLTLSVCKSGSRAKLEIADTGDGIPEENRDMIFEPLFSTKTWGIGFGLAIVKMVIDKHGGDICFESEAGKGTRFIICLPMETPSGEGVKCG